MGKQGHRQSRKSHSAVHFDDDERSQYLRSFIGAKKRRRQFYEEKVKEEAKKQRRLDKKDRKKALRQRIEKFEAIMVADHQAYEVQRKQIDNVVTKAGEVQIQISQL